MHRRAARGIIASLRHGGLAMASCNSHPHRNRFDPCSAGVAALLASLVTATLSVGAESAAPESSASSAQQQSASGSSVVLEPAPPPAKPLKSRIIFACRSSAVIEFSDRPCDLAATSRSLEFTTGSPAGGAPSTKPREVLASTRPKTATPPAALAPDASDADAQEKKCATLKGQLDAVDSRMREGYSAREAAKLWNRWRGLKDELHASDC
jgi:hypothetical protein